MKYKQFKVKGKILELELLPSSPKSASNLLRNPGVEYKLFAEVQMRNGGQTQDTEPWFSLQSVQCKSNNVSSDLQTSVTDYFNKN